MSNLLLSKIGHVISEFPLAFKQTKEVKLFMTLLVKNEEGMLEENLQFHKAMGVDGFIITDNNSTDSVSIRPRACFFPLFSFLPLWLHYNLNPLCVQY